MEASPLPGPQDGYVRLRLPKGVLLVLPRAQYRAGLKRGKAEQRGRRFAPNTQHAEVLYDPQAWSTKEGYYGPRYHSNNTHDGTEGTEI